MIKNYSLHNDIAILQEAIPLNKLQQLIATKPSAVIAGATGIPPCVSSDVGSKECLEATTRRYVPFETSCCTNMLCHQDPSEMIINPIGDLSLASLKET